MLSRYWYPLSYIAVLLLIVMFIILFLSVPLTLNWSSNLYGMLLRKFVYFLIFYLLIFSICYYHVGFESSDGSSPTFVESIYFSITSFTTLQYGEYRPLPQSRPLACIEAIMGLVAFVPIFAAVMWLYCQTRLWDKSLEQMGTLGNLRIAFDPIIGGWKEVENERTICESQERNARLTGLACSRCGSANLKIEKFYDVIGRTAPVALFVVHCPCGQLSKPSTTAYLAVWRWNQLNAKKRKKGH